MQTVKVSIITPVYRTPSSLLRRFIRSALDQTIHEIELILINDFSPDECPAILDTAAIDDSRVTVRHRTKNGRAGVARGEGLSLAHGEYVLFADADDVIRPYTCETLVRLAKQHSADIICCSWAICTPDASCVGIHSLEDRHYDLQGLKDRALCYWSLNYALWNKLFRRELIASLRFEQFEANIGEDLLFNIAALCRSRTIVTTSYDGYEYTVHGASATNRASKGMPYLRTLAASGDRIRETLRTADVTPVGKKYTDWLALKRYACGCTWIAENPDPKQRSEMWNYWRRYLLEKLLPELESYKLLGLWCKLLTMAGRPALVYPWMRYAMRIGQPIWKWNLARGSAGVNPRKMEQSAEYTEHTEKAKHYG